MKRVWVVLLALGLVGVLSTTGFALDVKFSGEFYVAGMYLDKTSLRKDEGPSTAFYFQRLRVRTDYIVSPGLKLITRFDAMERAWGATRSASSTTLASDSSGSRAENENIAFDWAYLEYKSPIGEFRVGAMNKGTTGTIFGNNIQPAYRIKYVYTQGPFVLDATYTKLKESSRTAINAVNYADADQNEYTIEPIYKWKDGRAGIGISYVRQADNRPASDYLKKYLQFTPYVITKFGPLALEAEVSYVTGKEREYETAAADVDLTSLSAYLNARANFGMFYAGGTIAYVSGDDPGTTDKREGGALTGGRDWNPTLIMWNNDRSNWAGALTGYNGASQDTRMANGFFVQARGGVKPVQELDIMASVSYAWADKKPWATPGDPTSEFVSNVYGWEVDVTATYKITQNLSYLLGAGYLFTGDFYKGASDANQLTNDFLVINKLTLTF
ncbi:MAG: hypothetical protein R6W75_03940 [Smithellaceae bacterium]